MIKFLINVGILGFLTLWACQSSAVEAHLGSYSAKVVVSPAGGFGYDIYENGALRIHQPHIPAVSGQKGFNRAEDALKTARFVMEKMQKGIMPPTLSEAELTNLGVLAAY